MMPFPLDLAIEVFARGVAFTRSFTHPYLVSKTEGVWWLRDGPRARGRGRNDEWITAEPGTAKNVDASARTRGGRGFLVNAVASDARVATELKAEYRALGYRLWRTESLMARPIASVPRTPAAAKIQRVRSNDMAARLATAAGERLVVYDSVVAYIRRAAGLALGETGF